MTTKILQEFIGSLRHSFQSELLELINKLAKDTSSKTIEALSIYSAGGFRSVGYALRRAGDKSSSESNELDAEFLAILEGHTDLEGIFASPSSNSNDLYFEICADEWTHINEIDCFSKTNDLIESNLDKLYDSGVEQTLVQSEILSTFIDSFNTLICKELSTNPVFSPDAFFSIQFSGGVNSSILLESSKILSNTKWQEKVEQFIEENP